MDTLETYHTPNHDIDHAIPRTATSTKVAVPTTHGYLDIGTRAITQWKQFLMCPLSKRK
jgi:hypothetical protein